MTLDELIQELPQARATGPTDIEINALEYDSRLVRPNALFFAVSGLKDDGFRYVQQAKENGAVAVMGERASCSDIDSYVQVPDTRKAMAGVAARFYGYPAYRLTMTGVTGTNGKTTVCDLIRGILETAGRRSGLITSLAYDTGGETFPAERTTPEALDLQRLLLLMIEHGCTDAVLEVSSHALSLKRVDGIEFLAAVYTNLSRDHLDFHGSMESYLDAKALLLEKLEEAAGCLVVNLGVPEFRHLMGRADQVLTYALDDTAADIRCSNYRLSVSGTTFDLVTPAGTDTVTLKLPGRYNLINALAAAAAAVAHGMDLETIVAGLEAAEPVPGRFNIVNVTQPFGVVVDYAHTPDALERLCQSARELTEGRLLLLFGCGGNRDRGKRPLMGKAAVANSDLAVLTTDNPRDEDPQQILDEVQAGMTGGNYQIQPDRRSAIETVLREASDGDVVIIAGKGAEAYQEIKGVRYPFDDRQEAIRVIAEMGYDEATRGTRK